MGLSISIQKSNEDSVTVSATNPMIVSLHLTPESELSLLALILRRIKAGGHFNASTIEHELLVAGYQARVTEGM